MPNTIEAKDAVAELEKEINRVIMILRHLRKPNAPSPKTPEEIKAEQAESLRHSSSAGIRAARASLALGRFVPPVTTEQPVATGQAALEGIPEAPPKPLSKQKEEDQKKAKAAIVTQLEEAVWRSAIGLCNDLASPRNLTGKDFRKRCRVLGEQLSARHSKPDKGPDASSYSSTMPCMPDDFEKKCEKLLSKDQRHFIKAGILDQSIKGLESEIKRLASDMKLPRDLDPARQ